MKNPLESNNSVYDVTIRLLILLLVVAWCLLIMYPFLSIILWSLILTIAIFPLHKSLTKNLKGSPKLASTIIILSLLIIIIIPTGLLISSLFDEAKELKASYE